MEKLYLGVAVQFALGVVLFASGSAASYALTEPALPARSFVLGLTANVSEAQPQSAKEKFLQVAPLSVPCPTCGADRMKVAPVIVPCPACGTDAPRAKEPDGDGLPRVPKANEAITPAQPGAERHRLPMPQAAPGAPLPKSKTPPASTPAARGLS